ncbi:phosphotransferase enzyme family protein [bacterium BMS3Bbin06]|nr:phosphotransferase enzyme family protein [bacterium BMS3Abin08]GBE35523.1 phosphotransferase enzyme family protein [bacterium BMS3Bbin06]HDO35239.1 aminoglycoside phosphotransferase family protein [Nitrospirota bacterium]HDY72114.1 aminoglycoside phosphotransferase family protein [Nitrospirota bacterium]
MIERESLLTYLRERFGDVCIKRFERLGAGVHGTGFSLVIETGGREREYVVKDLAPEGLGHDYPSDRAAVLLLAYDEYGNLPKHIRAVDVVALTEDGSVRSVSGGKEYFLVMEKAEGTNYFSDLEEMKDKAVLSDMDRKKIQAMAGYLKEIHSVKKESKTLYRRKIRDTIGHGECLMGVFDSYPDGVVGYDTMAEIEKLCVDWRARLKPFHGRLCQIHGDFHPGNIWFRGDDFVLLDRSRGPWGDGADDITAMTINYIFYSIMYHDSVTGAYREALELFYERYIELTGDREILSVVAPFYAFRGAVVAHPVFYPQLGGKQRIKVFSFMRNVLLSERFEPERVNDLLV